MTQPTVVEFLVFVQRVMGIPPSYLPATAPIVTYSFNQALALVNRDLRIVPHVHGTWSIFSQAVFNLAGALLIEYAPDVSYGIGQLSWASGLVTVTTTTTNSVLVGDAIVISGVSPNGYNGATVVNSVLDTTRFTYPLKANFGIATVQQTIPNPVYTDRVTEGNDERLTEDEEHRIILPINYQPFVTINAQASEQFFVNARAAYKMSSFVPGVISSASDVGTSAGYDNPDFLKGLTLYDLQLMKSPFGRAYLALAQKYGPNIWGIS